MPQDEPPGREPDGGSARSEPPSRSSDEEARQIVSDVLRDQAERRTRQEEATRHRQKKRLPLPIVAGMLALASLYVWAATPSWLTPEPLPEPTAMQLEAGLRMEMYGLVVQVERYRSRNGRLPEALADAAEDPPEDVEYRHFPPASYRLQGERAGTEIIYSSGEPVQTLLGDAPERIRSGAGASP